MALADRCQKEFPADVRLRGWEYYCQGHVKIDPGWDNSGVWAHVKGSGRADYEVMVDWSEARPNQCVSVFCDCPYFDDWGLCKHVWATMLQADAQGAAAELGGQGQLKIEPEYPEDNSSDRDDEEFEDALRSENYTAVFRHLEQFGLPGRIVGKKQPPRQPDWRQRLQALQTSATQTGRGQIGAPPRPVDQPPEIWFRLDVGVSTQRQMMAIQFHQRTRKKNGEFGALRPAKFSERETQSQPHELRELLEILLRSGGEEVYSSYSYSSYRSYGSSLRYGWSTLPPAMYNLILPRLCATGHFVGARSADDDLTALPPLAWDGGEPWKLHLVVSPVEGKEAWQIDGELRRGELRDSIRKPLLVFQSGWLVFPESVARLDAAGNEGWLAPLRQGEPIQVPHKDQDALVEFLYQMPSLPSLELPEELRWQELRPAPRRKVALLTPDKHTHGKKIPARIVFEYDGQQIEWQQRKSAILDREARCVLLRDRQAEQAAYAELLTLGFRDPAGFFREPCDLHLPAKSLPKVVRQLVAAGWLVEAEGKLFRQPGEFKLSVSSGVDWFELNGSVDFEGTLVSLPALLAALQRGETFVPLGDGSQGMLPEKWLERYAPLVGLGHTEGDALRFVRAQVGILDALLAAEPEIDVDAQFEQARAKLRAFSGVHPADQPPSFQGQLREYQREGLGWLHFLADFGFGGCLADDMGLGKTIQVLAFLESRRVQNEQNGHEHNGQAENGEYKNGRSDLLPERRPSLVVVPRSLVFNWLDEAARFTPNLRVLDYTGLERGATRERFATADLIITTYGTLRRDIVELKDFEFDYAILDEAQAIKNAASQAAKACRLLHARHRLAMTGTPVENHLGELWSLCDFLNPGMLGRSPAMKLLTSAGRSENSHESRQFLAQALRPFILRRTKEQVLRELPEKTEQTLFCELDRKQRKHYNELRDHYRALLTKKIGEVGLQRAKIHVLEALLRLRQAACHPGLIDKKQVAQSSAKLDALWEQLTEVLGEGHKALVFSQFTSLLAIVRQRLEQEGVTYEYLDGKTRDRQQCVNRFQQDPNCQLFLISLKAGGQGLNLTAADYVFILDPWWNPAVEAQAVDRAHRIGQTQRVFAYRLIARDTVEEKILELQRDKKQLADAIISADNSLISRLSADDLRLLLS